MSEYRWTRSDWLGACLLLAVFAAMFAADWIQTADTPQPPEPPVEARALSSSTATGEADNPVLGAPPAAPVVYGVGQRAVVAGEYAALAREARDAGAAVAIGAPAPEPTEDARALVGEGQVLDALAVSPWPRALWPDVLAIARCEAGVGDAIDLAAVGDGGLALGPMQIRKDYHPRLYRSFDLHDLSESLAASYIIYLEAGRSFGPWVCA